MLKNKLPQRCSAVLMLKKEAQFGNVPWDRNLEMNGTGFLGLRVCINVRKRRNISYMLKRA